MAPPHEPALRRLTGTGPAVAAALADAWTNGDAVVVTTPDRPAPALPERVPPGVNAVVATSGTTGEPRLVALTQSGLHASAHMIADALHVDPTAPWLCALPLHYVAGLAVVGRAWSLGAPVVVHDRFDVDTVAAAINDESVAYVSLVSTALLRLLDADVPIETLQGILLGGGPIDHALVARARARGARVHCTYGMTETWGGIVHDGHPLPGVEVRLGGPDANDIEVHTPTVMHGYLNDPTGTRAAFTDDGWLRTGDIGAWRNDGALIVIDRRKDVILSGGVTLIPATIDTALRALPHCVDAAAVGAPDPEWGERVVACVVWDAGVPVPTLDSLRDALRPHLPAAALPRELRVVDAIPRSTGGKILRRELRTNANL